MKTYCELVFRGIQEQLQEFVDSIREHPIKDWKVEEYTEGGKDYLWIDYIGTIVDKARVSIYLGDDLKRGEIKVGNIVPLEKNKLNIDEYNAVLKKFDGDIIAPYRTSCLSIEIGTVSSDIFDPTSLISPEALEKLRCFCNLANKTTGSSHPSDKERWFDFICQTVDDGQTFDYSTLGAFLADTDYWGEKSKEYIGAMGSFAWDKESAYELAAEYYDACDVLEFYKRTRGL